MDLNYLFSRHQIALMQAEAADTCEARGVHRGLVKEYAARIEALQRLAGAKFSLAG